MADRDMVPGYKWITNIGAETIKQEERIQRSNRKDVEFRPALDGSGNTINEMMGVYIKPIEVTGARMDPRTKSALVIIAGISPSDSYGVEHAKDDSDAHFYRGTTLGYVVLSLVSNGEDMLSFDDSRQEGDTNADYVPAKTTVVSDSYETAKYYAKEHKWGKPTNEHDVGNLSTQLDIPEADIKEKYPALLMPVVLAFGELDARESSKYMHEFHTSKPVNLRRCLTDRTKEFVGEYTGMNL
jgi:hypothetical protein